MQGRKEEKARKRDETRLGEKGKMDMSTVRYVSQSWARLHNQMASVPGQSREMWLASGQSAMVKGFSMGIASSPFRPASITSPLLGLGAIPADVSLSKAS